MTPGMGMGGAWVSDSMMGGMPGPGGGMMGDGWRDGEGHQGMMFAFTV
jgi:hypothetical protein